MKQQEAQAIVSEVAASWPGVTVEVIDKYSHRLRAGYQVKLTRQERVLSIRYGEDWLALKEMWRSEQLEVRQYA